MIKTEETYRVFSACKLCIIWQEVLSGTLSGTRYVNATSVAWHNVEFLPIFPGVRTIELPGMTQRAIWIVNMNVMHRSACADVTHVTWRSNVTIRTVARDGCRNVASPVVTFEPTLPLILLYYASLWRTSATVRHYRSKAAWDRPKYV